MDLEAKEISGVSSCACNVQPVKLIDCEEVLYNSIHSSLLEVAVAAVPIQAISFIITFPIALASGSGVALGEGVGVGMGVGVAAVV